MSYMHSNDKNGISAKMKVRYITGGRFVFADQGI